jgi:hypothetical protein
LVNQVDSQLIDSIVKSSVKNANHMKMKMVKIFLGVALIVILFLVWTQLPAYVFFAAMNDDEENWLLNNLRCYL